MIAGVHGRNSLGAQELVKSGITIQEIDITDAQSVGQFVQTVEKFLERDNLCECLYFMYFMSCRVVTGKMDPFEFLNKIYNLSNYG